MAKDYHKGKKLQLYISDELNDKINACVEAINVKGDNSPMYLDHYTKSDFIRISLEATCDCYLERS